MIMLQSVAPKPQAFCVVKTIFNGHNAGALSPSVYMVLTKTAIIISFVGLIAGDTSIKDVLLVFLLFLFCGGMYHLKTQYIIIRRYKVEFGFKSGAAASEPPLKVFCDCWEF